MTILQKRAWINLAGSTSGISLAGAGVGIAVHFNVRGVVPLMAFIIAALIVGLISCLHSIKIQKAFDERETKIAIRAFVISSHSLTLFLCFASFAIFYLSGARNHIPAYTLPVLLLIGLFISQVVRSAMILIQFAQEQADEQ